MSVRHPCDPGVYRRFLSRRCDRKRLKRDKSGSLYSEGHNRFFIFCAAPYRSVREPQREGSTPKSRAADSDRAGTAGSVTIPAEAGRRV